MVGAGIANDRQLFKPSNQRGLRFGFTLLILRESIHFHDKAEILSNHALIVSGEPFKQSGDVSEVEDFSKHPERVSTIVFFAIVLDCFIVLACTLDVLPGNAHPLGMIERLPEPTWVCVGKRIRAAQDLPDSSSQSDLDALHAIVDERA